MRCTSPPMGTKTPAGAAWATPTIGGGGPTVLGRPVTGDTVPGLVGDGGTGTVVGRGSWGGGSGVVVGIDGGGKPPCGTGGTDGGGSPPVGRAGTGGGARTGRGGGTAAPSDVVFCIGWCRAGGGSAAAAPLLPRRVPRLNDAGRGGRGGGGAASSSAAPADAGRPSTGAGIAERGGSVSSGDSSSGVFAKDN